MPEPSISKPHFLMKEQAAGAHVDLGAALAAGGEDVGCDRRIGGGERRKHQHRQDGRERQPEMPARNVAIHERSPHQGRFKKIVGPLDL